MFTVDIMTEIKKEETLRSSFTPDGGRLFLCFDEEAKKYRVGTRWSWFCSFDNIHDSGDAFDVLEMLDDADKEAIKFLKMEIKRNPRTRCDNKGMSRAFHLLHCVEQRKAGFKPQASGSKHSVINWVKA